MIEIQDVSKQFDCVAALRHLTLKVQDGSVFGLVGSNGAFWPVCIGRTAGGCSLTARRLLRMSRSSAALCLSRTIRI